jgi:tryptophan-rich sensory protein
MAIAAWWVYKTPSKYRKAALWSYVVQLALNTLWSPVFFGAKLLLPGFLIAIALALSVFVAMCLFHLVIKKAGILLAPYFGWCVFASLLSYELLILN